MIITKMAAQGDVLVRRVKSLPKEAQELHPGVIVVAHSETGHHHVIEGPGVTHFKMGKDDLVSFLRIEAEFADVVHKRSWDTHAPLRLEGRGALWEVRRQREWTPEGWRRVED